MRRVILLALNIGDAEQTWQQLMPLEAVFRRTILYYPDRDLPQRLRGLRGITVIVSQGFAQNFKEMDRLRFEFTASQMTVFEQTLDRGR